MSSNVWKGTLVAAATCLAAVGLYSQTPPRPRPPGGGIGKPGPLDKQTPIDKEAVDRGKRTFVASCGFCHGANATGGESGPDLIRSVTVAHDKDGDLIGPIILNGRPAKGMPKFPLSKTQISDVAAFLHQKAEEKSNRGAYTILNVVTGDAKAGQAYFAGHCASCHSPAGDLAHIAGKYEPVMLQQRFLYPRGRIRPGAQRTEGEAPTPVKVTVTPPSGKPSPACSNIWTISASLCMTQTAISIPGRATACRASRSTSTIRSRSTLSCWTNTPTPTCTISSRIWRL